MKHLRLFEDELKYKYKVGDYVSINYDTKSNTLTKLKDFVNNSIGKIMFIDDKSMIIQYVNIPDKIKHFFSDKNVGKDKIKNSVFFWNKNNTIKRLATDDEIIEYEAIKNTNKFNI